MRLLESGNPKLLGVILVAAAYTDLGDEDEARSEYFNRSWNWEMMKEGAEHIVLFHGTEMNDANHFTFIEMANKSHFFRPWQEILGVFDDKFGNGCTGK